MKNFFQHQKLRILDFCFVSFSSSKKKKKSSEEKKLKKSGNQTRILNDKKTHKIT